MLNMLCAYLKQNWYFYENLFFGDKLYSPEQFTI